MTRRVIGIGVVGVLCVAGSIASLFVAVTLLDVSGVLRIDLAEQTEPSAELDNRFAIAQAGYTVLRFVAPLSGGFLLAVIAILTLLALHWRRPTA